MGVLPPLLAAFDFALRETILFAAAGFFILGLSDIALDLVWIGLAGGRLLIGRWDDALADLPEPAEPGRLAVFVPAWDESDVIAPMLRNALKAWGDGDFRLYVGCYPNDPETIAAVRDVGDPRIRVAIGPNPGPTTKGDCLNRIWAAMVEDERTTGRRFKAVVLHDAEDVVHSAELRIFDALIERFDLVQLPVLPLIDERSRWVAGHYADEFAEAHGKALVVREAIGAALPSAGVGCAVARDALDRMAQRHGAPFDAESLTEDYELGLTLGRDGGRAAFVRLRAGGGRAVVATREYFPATFPAAVSQKARWTKGIALSGWDRLGWSGGLAERWMRMRDRQSLFAALLLLVGYVAGALWIARAGATVAGGVPALHISGPLAMLLFANLVMLLWRLAMRFGFVCEAYGWREGLRSLPRVFIANFIAVLAARLALSRYASARGPAVWDKTRHAFPDEVPAE